MNAIPFNNSIMDKIIGARNKQREILPEAIKSCRRYTPKSVGVNTPYVVIFQITGIDGEEYCVMMNAWCFLKEKIVKENLKEHKIVIEWKNQYCAGEKKYPAGWFAHFEKIGENLQKIGECK